MVAAKLKTTRMSKKSKVTFSGHTNRITGTLTHNENHLFSYSDDNTIRIWNAETCQQIAVCSAHTSSFIDVHISGDKIVSASNDSTVRVWNKHTGEHRERRQHEQRISALCTYGTKIFTAKGNTLLIWDRDTQELLHTCTGQNRDAKVL